MRIHPKNVHENSPKKRTSRGQKCPRKVTKGVHKNSPFLSTEIRPLCPREVCHPFITTRLLFAEYEICAHWDCLGMNCLYLNYFEKHLPMLDY